MTAEGELFDGRKPGALEAGLKAVWQCSPVGFVLLSMTWIVRGLVPPAAAVLAGRAVGAIPGAVAAGGLHGEGRPLARALLSLTALYAGSSVADRLLFGVQEGWSMRTYSRIQQRELRAQLAPPLLDHLLDPEVQRLVDLAGRQEWPHLGAFGGACLQVAGWLTTAIVQAVLVARFSVPLAVLTTAGWLSVGSWLRRQELVGMLSGWDLTRRAHYFRRLALEHRSAGEVRTFGLGPWLIGRYSEGWRAGMSTAWRMRAATGRRAGPVLALLVAGNLVGILLIARGAWRGELAPAELTVVTSAFIGLTNLALPQEWTEQLLWGATRVPALFDLEQVAAAEKARVTPATPVPCEHRPIRSIRFEGVTFTYPGRSQPVLDGVDLELPVGGSLAIVGVNGAGKTTLAKLLSRLHDPTAGRIVVDDVDLRDFDPVAWQRRVAAIFQDYVRYPLPVLDNVALSQATAPRALDVAKSAAMAAGASEVISQLGQGWDTVLSRRYSRGADLSGGEWQRIALARAVYAVAAGAGVLVLDEPTANLDARGEAELFDRFLEVAQGATTVLISHRFSTVRRADRIAVLDGGRVVEEGTHDELIALGGRYAAMFALQADRYRELT